MILLPGVAFAYVRVAGASLLLDCRDGGVPVIAHWGADAGELSDRDVVGLADAVIAPRDLSHGYAVPVRPRLLMLESDAWKGRPGIGGHRVDGSAWTPAFRLRSIEADSGAHRSADVVRMADGGLRFTLVDETSELELIVEVELLASGLVRSRATLRNDGESAYHLDELAVALPAPLEADELLDFGGRWSRERAAFRGPVGPHAHVHESREGRPGFAAAPMLVCGATGFDFGAGEVFGVHVGFSGNQRSWIERDHGGIQILAGGELLLPGEIRLGTGEDYRSPWVYFGSGNGLDALAHQVHAWLRSRPGHPGFDRPVTLNVWEAVYFDHDLTRLLELAEVAARVGVERFVLDDGWFAGRRTERAGLGDWRVDTDVWPAGLHPLVNRVRELGMEFGLWVEPEMVNPDSDVARAHPDWILSAGGALPVSWRHQQVLNLTDPDAFAHVHSQLAAILDEYDISYLKWDHNRELVSAGDVGHAGRAAVHEQTLACYRLMDALAERRPGLEIESCASGGGRIDLGMAEHVQRFWPSDCIDPLERYDIMRWTSQLMPLEMLGAHVSGPRSRTTGRTSTLAFRATGALFGHLGVEWDLTSADEAELNALAGWVECFRRHRETLFTGRLHRRDVGDGTLALRGVVDPDARRGLFELTALRRAGMSPVGRVHLPGLVPERAYRVRVHDPRAVDGLVAPTWMDAEGTILPGAVLGRVGLQAPEMFPEQSLLIEVEEVSPT